METVSEEFKKKFAKAERAGEATFETRQILNILSALDVPKGISVSGTLASFFVAKAQERGLTVPASKLTTVEARNFKSQIMKTCPDFDVKIDESVRKQILAKGGIKVQPTTASAPQEDNRYRYWTDDMLIMANNLHKDALLAEELRAHPLLAIAMKRAVQPQLPVRRKPNKR